MLSSKTKFGLKITAVAFLGIVFVSGLFTPTLLHLAAAFPAHPKLTLLPDTLLRVGDALIIAVVLAFLVDLNAKKELLREFLLETSAHIIGRQLPEQIRE